jgi:transcriptional repressor NrdR
MQCVACKYPDSRVVKSLDHEQKNLVERRRECLRCGARFTTHEKMREPKKPKSET